MSFIKVGDDGKLLASADNATGEMLADGWVSYEGDIPVYAKMVDGVLVDDLDAEKSAQNTLKKTNGVEYKLNGISYTVPINTDAQNLVTAINAQKVLGIFKGTTLRFSNGTTMPITSNDWGSFAKWFAETRNEMFL